MALSRYSGDAVIAKGTRLATARAFRVIRAGVKSRRIKSTVITTQGLARLDQLAGQYYGNGVYWWIIAAASDIGWGLQVPGGTRLNIPDIAQAVSMLE